MATYPSSYVSFEVYSDHFSITHSPKKKESAVSALTKIYKVIQENLPYASSAQDRYTSLSRDLLHRELWLIAGEISKGYDGKRERIVGEKCWTQLSPCNFLEARDVSSAYRRIDHLVSSLYPPFFLVPTEVIVQIVSHLHLDDLFSLYFVHPCLREHIDFIKIAQQEFGFKGNDLREIINYLLELKDEIELLERMALLPISTLRPKERRSRGVEIDWVETLKNYQNPDHRQNIFLLLSKKKLYSLKPFPNRFLHLLLSNLKVRSQKEEKIVSEAFYQAALHDCAKIAGLFLLAGAKIDYRDDSGNTALSHKAEEGNMEAVVWLCAKQADPLITNRSGKTPIMLADRAGHTEIGDFLVSFLRRGRSIYHLTIVRGESLNEELFRNALKVGAFVVKSGKVILKDSVFQSLALGAGVKLIVAAGAGPVAMIGAGIIAGSGLYALFKD